MPLQKDWQTSCHSIQGRIEYMFKMGESSDCQFMVGSEPNHQIFHGHKFIFAMTSPVFNTMFNGSLQEKDEVIQILDVQPTTFQTLLEYIYLDKINVKSAEEAFQLGYVAKKYMLPYVYDCCVKFLENNVCCENACKIYEFALLFEENRLAASSFELICAQTERILKLPNFEETSLTTFQVIFDQNSLNITNELTLFLALARFADKYEDRYTKKNGKDEDDRLNDSLDLPSSRPPIEDVKPVQGIPDHSHIIDAVKKIRFLCFTPQQFADNVPQTNPNCSLW